VHGAAVLHSQGTRTSVVTCVTPLVAFGSDEIGQNLTIRPSWCALVHPSVEINWVSADVDHGVHRRTAAECSAARQVDPTPPERLFRLGLKVPIVLSLEQLGKGDGHADLGRVVRTARLQQGHPKIRILAEASREDASSRTSANYYVVKFLYRPCNYIGHINLLLFRSHEPLASCSGICLLARSELSETSSRYFF